MSTRWKVVGSLYNEKDSSSHNIMFDMTSGEFRVKFGETLEACVVADSLKGVTLAARKWMSENTNIEFEAFIWVEADAKRRYEFSSWRDEVEHHINFAYGRAFRGKRADGSYFWREWVPIDFKGEDAMDAEKGKPGGYCSNRSNAEDSTLFPYTAEQWKGLRKITHAIASVQSKLAILRTSGAMPSFLLHVASGATPLLLEAPKPEKKKRRS